MTTLLAQIAALNLPQVPPMPEPHLAIQAAANLGLSLTRISSSPPEQYVLTRNGIKSGYVRARHGGMQVDYPDAGDENLYHGAIDGFGGFTDDERETRLLYALTKISARMLLA
jgi:hypothetical protein